MAAAEQTLREALDAFDFGGPAAKVRRIGGGHINDTFRVSAAPEAGGGGFILQRLSAAAFKRPDQVMANILGVTEYLREQLRRTGGNPDRETLRVIRTRGGGPLFTDSQGGAWRAFPFIEDVICLQSARTAEEFAAAGRAFGRFQRLLSGYPAGTLYETIPRFHDTPDRLRKLKEAAEADKLGRARECGGELAFAMAREADCAVAVDALRAGRLPLRVTHNDTKLSNVLLDRTTGESVCVIDLDTVMPGLCLYDFGDSIRSGASRCAEDQRDLRQVRLDLSFFRAYTAAFLEGAGDILTEEEVRSLPWGTRLMTLECGIRFLTDYLEGDVYFRIDRPSQNLDRARVQFTLLEDIEAHWGELEEIVQTLWKSWRA